jgi:flagellar basal-body rod protein FlgB
MADSKFIPLTGQYQSAQDFQETVLGVFAKRQEVIAANIANADTPNFKARDIDFSSALHAAQARAAQPAVGLNVTSAAHIAAKGGTLPATYDLLYSRPNQPSADGNTVEMDAERSKFAENSAHYEFSLQYVGNDFKELISLLNNLK